MGLDTILKIKESEWSTDIERIVLERRKRYWNVQLGVTEGVQQIASVGITELNSGKIEINDVRGLCPGFAG